MVRNAKRRMERKLVNGKDDKTIRNLQETSN
jgi:hypothetical protein